MIPEKPTNNYGRSFNLSRILQKAVIDYMSEDNKTPKLVRPDYLSSIASDRLGWFSRSVLSAIMYSVYSKIIENQS
ncbi:MAG: hypothetical protein P8X91_04690 [Candidatus Bathyarchaeota archaeon]